tara:strand:+ start:205 stop:447 length:243 start_codon:yes stop_codon:yes gene_type:complete
MAFPFAFQMPRACFPIFTQHPGQNPDKQVHSELHLKKFSPYSEDIQKTPYMAIYIAKVLKESVPKKRFAFIKTEKLLGVM